MGTLINKTLADEQGRPLFGGESSLVEGNAAYSIVGRILLNLVTLAGVWLSWGVFFLGRLCRGPSVPVILALFLSCTERIADIAVPISGSVAGFICTNCHI